MDDRDAPDPRQAGLDAYSHEVSRSACPYPEGSAGRAAWLAGWDEAEGLAQTIR